MTTTTPTPKCVLCGEPLEPWHPGSTGYGHNPEPLVDFSEGRCCTLCNDTKVLPERIKRIRGGLLMELFDQSYDPYAPPTREELLDDLSLVQSQVQQLMRQVQTIRELLDNNNKVK